MQRTHREYSTAQVIIAFARYATPIDLIARALAVGPDQIERVCRNAIRHGELAMMPPPNKQDAKGALLAEVVNLRAKVASLQDILRDAAEQSDARMQPFFGLCGFTRHEATLVALLAEKGRTTKDQLYHALYGDHVLADQPEPKIIDVFVCKVRKKLPAKCTIDTLWGIGYAMTPASVAVLRGLMAPQLLERAA